MVAITGTVTVRPIVAVPPKLFDAARMILYVPFTPYVCGTAADVLVNVEATPSPQLTNTVAVLLDTRGVMVTVMPVYGAMEKLAVGVVAREAALGFNTIDMLFVLVPFALVTVRTMVFVPVVVYVTAAGFLPVPEAGEAPAPKFHE
jgi:hypothetical protein